MSFGAWHLSAECTGHTQDIRGLAAHPDGFVSASRDTTLRIWNYSHPPGEHVRYETFKELRGHEHFASSVCVVPAGTNPMRWGTSGFSVVSGGQDKSVRVWTGKDISAHKSVIMSSYTLTGHTANVCAVSLGKDGDILSGSWDKTARVWKGHGEARQLAGHTQAVWAVLQLPTGRVVTASADKSLRMWSDGGVCMGELHDHTDCVRGLALIDDLGFVSCANDNLIKLWSFDGDCLLTFVGHEKFVYAVAYNRATGEIVSCSEDNTVKVWKTDGSCVATIPHPSTVWCVAALDNGDIVTGCADGVARVWTKDFSRYANADAVHIYDANLAAVAAAALEARREKLRKLPGLDSLHTPGRKENDVKVVRSKDGNSAEAYTWRAGSWHYEGEVVDPPDSTSGPEIGKKMLHGKEYDLVFDVDLGDGQIRQIGHNLDKNPYLTAQEFIYQENLNQDYLTQIGEFIIRNTQHMAPAAPAPQGASDPYTGGSRYIPGGGGGGASAAAASGPSDPFTGANRYVPGSGGSAHHQPHQQQQQQQQGAGFQDPFILPGRYIPSGSPYAPGGATGGNSGNSGGGGGGNAFASYAPPSSVHPTPAAAANAPHKVNFPLTQLISVDTGTMAPIVTKLVELNKNVAAASPGHLTPKETQALETMLRLVDGEMQRGHVLDADKSFEVTFELEPVLMKILDHWETDKLFPAMDMVRLLLRAGKIDAHFVLYKKIPERVVNVLSRDKVPNTLYLTALRLLLNMMTVPEVQTHLLAGQFLHQVLETTFGIVKTHWAACSLMSKWYLLSVWVNALLIWRQSGIKDDLYKTKILECLQALVPGMVEERDLAVQSLLVFGQLIYDDPKLAGVAAASGLAQTVQQIRATISAARPDEKREGDLDKCKEILDMLSK